MSPKDRDIKRLAQVALYMISNLLEIHVRRMSRRLGDAIMRHLWLNATMVQGAAPSKSLNFKQLENYFSQKKSVLNSPPQHDSFRSDTSPARFTCDTSSPKPHSGCCHWLYCMDWLGCSMSRRVPHWYSMQWNLCRNFSVPCCFPFLLATSFLLYRTMHQTLPTHTGLIECTGATLKNTSARSACDTSSSWQYLLTLEPDHLF